MTYVQAIPVPNPVTSAPPQVAVVQQVATPPQVATSSQASAPTAQKVSTAPTAAPSQAANDPLGGVRENMPYALARAKLFAAGWQTQFFKPANLSEQDRDARQSFLDHHISEVEHCSASGCKMQLHNMDGRLLYVYTQSGSHNSDAYRGAGPAVIATCFDVDDITCPTQSPSPATATQQAIR